MRTLREYASKASFCDSKWRFVAGSLCHTEELVRHKGPRSQYDVMHANQTGTRLKQALAGGALFVCICNVKPQQDLALLYGPFEIPRMSWDKPQAERVLQVCRSGFDARVQTSGKRARCAADLFRSTGKSQTLNRH